MYECEVSLDLSRLWHRVGDDAFGPPFGTVRVCRVCGCLVAGGPTACGRCAREERSGAPRSLRRRLRDAWAGMVAGWRGVE